MDCIFILGNLMKLQLYNEKPVAFAEESRSSGTVTFATYCKYFYAGGGFLSIFFLLFLSVVTQFFFSGSDYWLSLWTDAEQIRARQGNSSSINSTECIKDLDNSTFLVKREDDSNLKDWLEEIDTYTSIYVFTILTIGLFIFSFIRAIYLFVMFLNSSISLHNSMFQSVIRAPLLFFDRNPVGKQFLSLYQFFGY
jgi:ATP-binding cassette subfamily C (CFTR/MRP) protein 4